MTVAQITPHRIELPKNPTFRNLTIPKSAKLQTNQPT